MKSQLRSHVAKEEKASRSVGTAEAKDESGDPIFRGFIGGNAFITKKGHRGMSIDSLWVQNLFTSFNSDDDELAAVALQSSLADVNEVVVGGEFGSPYSIGEYGFYSESQFDQQADLLCETERTNAHKKFYLSEGEWETVDHYFKKLAHFSNSAFQTVRRGDTFGALAIKKNAFAVASHLIRHELDPLVENEHGDDIFRTVQQQYQDMTVQMKELSVVMNKALHSNTLRKQWEDLEKTEATMIASFEGMLPFADDLQANLELRLVQIEGDKKVQRRCELLHEPVTEHKLWNIAQEGKARQQIHDIESLKGFVTEKIFHYKHAQAERKAKRTNSNIKNKHIMSLLAARDNDECSSADGSAEGLEEGPDVNSESGRIDRILAAEARLFGGLDSESERSWSASSRKQAGESSSSGYKPIIGTLKSSKDTVISYR